MLPLIHIPILLIFFDSSRVMETWGGTQAIAQGSNTFSPQGYK